MYTGIIQGKAKVIAIEGKPHLRSFVFAFPLDLVEGLKTGASVSLGGVCLTVTKINAREISFDAMQETLKKTTLGDLLVGDEVNIERAAKLGDEIGGHVMSGHVSGKGKIVENGILKNGDWILKIEIDPALAGYVFEKGFVALDGVSLTVVHVEENTFAVHLIPETLARTTFTGKKVGDAVNVELDFQTVAVVETIRNFGRTTSFHP